MEESSSAGLRTVNKAAKQCLLTGHGFHWHVMTAQTINRFTYKAGDHTGYVLFGQNTYRPAMTTYRYYRAPENTRRCP